MYNKMKIPFLGQRRRIQRKTKALVDSTLLNKQQAVQTNKQTNFKLMPDLKIQS